ncbi:MAG: exonuclease SbcCD subunit D, partial [bacterium]
MRRSYITFLHIADLHLGRMAMGGKLKLPFDKAKKRQEEGFEVLKRALERAKELKVDVVLIAGDLWENDQIVPEQIGEVMRWIEEINVPVVLTPGNHDGVKEMGYHQPDMLSLITGRRFPPNFHIFRNYQDFEVITLPQLEGVQFVGLAYQDSQPVMERKLSQPLPLSQAEITIGVLH